MSSAIPSLAATERRAGWAAELDLGFAARPGRTFVARRRHSGPLCVQRAFHPEEGGAAHVYLLHPPGGLVAGDSLHIAIAAAAGAQALVTTPAATKIYRSGSERTAVQTVTLSAAEAATLEWLPQETIVFRQGRADLRTRVALAPGAAFIGWELVCLGRPASGERFDAGACRVQIELQRDGRPLVIERTQIEGGGELQAAPWGLAGAAVMGTMLLASATGAAFDLGEARALADLLPAGDRATATQLDGVVVCRYLGDSGERARLHFHRLWALLRPIVIGRAPTPPRIWLT